MIRPNHPIACAACLFAAVSLVFSSAFLVQAREPEALPVTTSSSEPAPILQISGNPVAGHALGDTGDPVSNMVITGYKVHAHGSKREVQKIRKGDKVDIEINVTNTGLSASDVSSKNDLDFIKPADSFTCDDDPKVKLNSSSGPLDFTVTFPNAVYNGSGNTFRFLVSYSGLSIPFDTGEVSILQCVEGTTSTPDDNASSPLVQVTRGSVPSVASGEKFSLTLHIANLSKDLSLENMVASFDLSESLLLLDASSSKVIPTLGAGQSTDITLSLQANGEITSPAQSVTANLKFDAVKNGVRTASTSTEKVTIPMKTTPSKDNAASPLVQISRSEIPGNLAAGQNFSLNVRVKNLSKDISMENILASFEPSDSLMLLESSSSLQVPNLAPGKTADVTLHLRTLQEITSPAQGLTANLKFDSVSGGMRTAGTSTEKLSIPVTPSSSKKVDSATPYVIISQYQYGEEVAAGKTFDLKLDFKNTSKTLAVENIVMTLETGEGLSITSSSNSFSFSKLGPGGVQSQTIPMQALAEAKPETAKISVSFKYEYVDGDKRTPVTAEEKIAIPVYQPDRFELTPPSFPDPLNAGEEATLSVNYVNKGKGELSNVSAELEGTVDSPMPKLNLGNLEAGKSGSIDFVFTPMEPGEQTINVKITYEDANLNVKERVLPVTFTVAEAMPPIDGGMDEGMLPPEESGSNLWILWVVLGGVAAGVGVLIFFLVRRKRNKRRKEQQEAVLWDLEEPVNVPSPAEEEAPEEDKTEEIHHEGR